MKSKKEESRDLVPLEKTTDKPEVLGKNLVARLKIPGLKKEEISVKVNKGYLEITAEKKHAEEKRGKGYYERKYMSASFYECLPLPKGIRAEDITTNYENGVLEIKKK